MALTHKEKKKLGHRLQTKAELKEKGKGVFDTVGWAAHVKAIADRVLRKQKKRMKILDDKGIEHQVGELIESKTLTIET